jgi:GTPase
MSARSDNDVRVAVIGNVDSGKSTMVGVLTKCIMDDGRGSARQKVFNFSHEAANGRTSSIGQEIMGFDENLKQIEIERANENKNKSWAHVANNSKKILTFLDLCGHEKYLKTTMFGLVGLMPDYAMIVVGANMGVSRMTKEHLGIALALSVPIFIVVTKIDIAPANVYEETILQLNKILKSPYAAKHPIAVKEEDDVSVYAKSIPAGTVCPVFSISNVSGVGIPKLKEFLSLLKSRIYTSGTFGKPDEPAEFLIDGIYHVTGVGIVVAGTLLSGTVNLGQTLLLGPTKTDQFKPMQVKGIHHKRIDVE